MTDGRIITGNGKCITDAPVLHRFCPFKGKLNNRKYGSCRQTIAQIHATKGGLPG